MCVTTRVMIESSIKAAVKRKRTEDVRPNERQLRSGRILKAKFSTDPGLKSLQRSCKSVMNEGGSTSVTQNMDLEITRTERPLKLLKVAGPGPSSIHEITNPEGMACNDGDALSVGLNTRQKANQLHALGTIIYSPRTPKQNRAFVEISSEKPSTEPIVARPYFPHKDAVVDDPNAFLMRLPICLGAQKKQILRTLRSGPLDNSDVLPTELCARSQLSELIQGSMTRGEGNSCIVLGPRGSGKTRIVESCIHDLVKPIILRLSGRVQTTDKQALREIATQLLHQTGSYLLSDTEHPDSTFVDVDENPFIEQPQVVRGTDAEHTIRSPPSSQLHALIPILSTLKRPVIVILDAFDLFALHPRQSLLYCLLDNVQNCRPTSGSQGIAVIGITTRVDTIQLLEKRVKSRFSGRIFRTAPPNSLEHWLSIAKNALLAPITLQEKWLYGEWHKKWTSSVEDFLSDSRVLDVFRETFGISKEIEVLIRLLTHSVLHLRPSEPYLNLKVLSASVDAQCSRPRSTHVNNLSYPMVCLIIASNQVEITGHPTFSFEMLFESFRDQVRASTSAPVQLNGGHVGMVRCTREVMLAAFDDLVSSHIFLPSLAPSTVVARGFVRHRCVLQREMMKRIVEKSGQIHLKKWFNKA